MDTDQMNYADMIAEARVLAEHLDEWNEQFPARTEESVLVWSALKHVEGAIFKLQGAQSENADRHADSVELALRRVATGAATIHDAVILREALK